MKRTEDYIKKAWAQNFFTKEDIDDIKETLACCDDEKAQEDFERWVKEELTHQVFVNLAKKVRFKKTEGEDGSVTYFACLDWLDVEEMVKDIEQEKGVKP